MNSPSTWLRLKSRRDTKSRSLDSMFVILMQNPSGPLKISRKETNSKISRYISSNTESGFKVGDKEQGADFVVEQRLRESDLNPPVLSLENFRLNWEDPCRFGSELSPVCVPRNLGGRDECSSLARCFSVWESEILCFSPPAADDVTCPWFDDDICQVNQEFREYSVLWADVGSRKIAKEGVIIDNKAQKITNNGWVLHF